MLKLHHIKRREADGLKGTVAKGYYELILHLNATFSTGWGYLIHGRRSHGMNKYGDTSISGRLAISPL